MALFDCSFFCGEKEKRFLSNESLFKGALHLRTMFLRFLLFISWMWCGFFSKTSHTCIYPCKKGKLYELRKLFKQYSIYDVLKRLGYLSRSRIYCCKEYSDLGQPIHPGFIIIYISFHFLFIYKHASSKFEWQNDANVAIGVNAIFHCSLHGYGFPALVRSIVHRPNC